MGISQFDDLGLYTTTTEELPSLIRVASNFMKNLNTPAPFHVPTIFTSAEAFLEEQRAVFIDHRTNSALELAEFFNKHISHTRTTRILVLQTFLSCMCSPSHDLTDRKGS